jgi:hypothetical protein
MNLVNEIMSRMGDVHQCTPIENGVRFTTHCLYPTNTNVQVAVMGAGNEFFVTDNAGAIKEASNSGAEIKNPDGVYKKLLEKQGLEIKNGAILSPVVKLDDIAAAIVIVANASKELSDFIFDSWKLKRVRNFKDQVRSLIINNLHKEAKEGKFAGRSNRQHTFENVIDLNGVKLIIDPVLKDANSINARFAANFDVRSHEYPNLVQKIIYDDSEEWSAADLSFLGDSGAPVIAYSKSEAILREVIVQRH